MADSVAEKCKKLTTSFFSYPKLFTNFTSKLLNEAEALRSPTSILDSKPFLYGFKNPFWSEANSPRSTTFGEHKHYWNKLDSKGLVDALVDINDDDNKHGGEITSKSQNQMILFGSQVKIQIPPSQSPTKSAAELGFKIRNNSQLEKSAFESANSALEIGTSKSPDRAFSATEMELCEEYTRVISHGPNPRRTTHIFDIESSYFHVGCSSSATENVFLPHHHISYPSESFLSFCFYCKKNLGHGIDIYMYRGERAFCSNECRYQGMLLEEGMSELEARDVYGNGTW